VHIPKAHVFPFFSPACRQVSSAVLIKGGHNGQNANAMVSIEASRRCVVILSNGVRSHWRD
jgi:hypothetical protein